MTAFLAERAYNKALATLSAITALPQPHQHQGSGFGQTPPSILSYLFPSTQGHGPFASALRIAIKLRNRTWVPRFISSMFYRDVGGTQQDEETYLDAAKVVLLLQHASGLGNLDALFTLASISLVGYITFIQDMHFFSDISYHSFHLLTISHLNLK